MVEELKEDISLKNRNKLPKEIKLKRNSLIFKNLILSIGIVLYLYFINLGFYNLEHSVYLTDLKVFSVAVLIVSIILFEKGYSNDDEGIFLNGIEMLVLALITMLSQYRIFNVSSYKIQLFFDIIFIFFILYYIIKSLIQTRMLSNKYKPSDARKIVQN